MWLCTLIVTNFNYFLTIFYLKFLTTIFKLHQKNYYKKEYNIIILSINYKMIILVLISYWELKL